MTEQAKMQPFYVLVNNETGASFGNYKTANAVFPPAEHRIEHILDQSALLEELRDMVGRLRQKGGQNFCTRSVLADSIDAILSRHGRE